MPLRPPPGALRVAAYVAAQAILPLTAAAASPEGTAAAPPRAAPAAPDGAHSSAPDGAHSSAPDGARSSAPDGARSSAPDGALANGPSDAAPTTSAPNAGAAAAASAPRPRSAPRVAIATRPPPLHVEYAQYGVALTAEIALDAGAACPDQSTSFVPCILGSGGGLLIRGGYRSAGPWYFGGAYEFTKMDSSNLYRLGIFQQMRAEMRYLLDTGYRAAPYFSAGAGGVAYGSEWNVDTGGALLFAGLGIELEVSRDAVLGVGCAYRPVLLAGWRDRAGHLRKTALAQFIGIELLLEVRTELGRR